MTHVAYPGCYCADCVEGTPSAWMYRFENNEPVILTIKRDWADNNPKWVETPLYPHPSARITGDKDRENPVEGAPTNRWLAIEVKRLRNVLRYITELGYADGQSGNQNYEYLQSIADSALRINAHTENPHD